MKSYEISKAQNQEKLKRELLEAKEYYKVKISSRSRLSQEDFVRYKQELSL